MRHITAIIFLLTAMLLHPAVLTSYEEGEVPSYNRVPKFISPDRIFKPDEFTWVFERHGDQYYIQKDGNIIYRPSKRSQSDTRMELHYTYILEIQDSEWPKALHVKYVDEHTGTQEFMLYMTDPDTIVNEKNWQYKKNSSMTMKKAYRSTEAIDGHKNRDALLTVQNFGFTEIQMITGDKTFLERPRPNVLYTIAPDGKNWFHYEPHSLEVSDLGDRILYFSNKPLISCQGAEGFIFTPDAKHSAFIGQMREGGYGNVTEQGTTPYRRAAFFNGKSDGRWWDSIHFVFLSDDGKRRAYNAIEGKTHRMVIDAKAGPVYDYTRMFAFSPDGKSWLYVARKGQVESVVYNGVEGPWFDAIDKPHFSPDSKSWYYLASEKTDEGYTTRLFINGKPVEISGYTPYDIYFSPGGKTEFILTEKNNVSKGPRDYAFINRKLFPTAFDISLSPDIDHFFVTSENGKGWGFFETLPVPSGAGYYSGRAVVNGIRQKDMHRHFLSDMKIAPDGKRHFYYGSTPGVGGWVIENNRKSPLNVSGACFSPDNRLFYWLHNGNDTVVYIDHKPAQTIKGIHLNKILYQDGFIFNSKGDWSAAGFRPWHDRVAGHPGKYFFIKNAQEAGGPYDKIESLKYLSLTGKFSGAALRNKKFYVVSF